MSIIQVGGEQKGGDSIDTQCSLLGLCLSIALVPTVCNQFDRGNALHIAATNLSLKSAKVLVKHNADGGWKDEQNRLPHECIPDGKGCGFLLKY